MADQIDVALSDIDLSDIEFWAKPWDERNAAFATLRREKPIAFFKEPIIEPFPQGPGYYAITRLADILAISRNPEVFSSASGAVSVLDLPAEMNEFFGSMISAGPAAAVLVAGPPPGLLAPSVANCGLAASHGAHPVTLRAATALRHTAARTRLSRRMGTTVATEPGPAPRPVQAPRV